mgnify:CR=1 FL=1
MTSTHRHLILHMAYTRILNMSCCASYEVTSLRFHVLQKLPLQQIFTIIGDHISVLPSIQQLRETVVYS